MDYDVDPKKVDKAIKKDLNGEEGRYLSYHKRRIAFNVELVLDILKAIDGGNKKLLDVGPHFQTRVFRRCLGHEVEINTLGWVNNEIVPKGVYEKHFQFDLNNAEDKSLWPDPESHDLVVMAEVIEHLYTSPSIVLDFLKRFVATGGYFVLQTPNAVDAKKRLQMLLGNHPYERIREDRSNPGHFREYTKTELRDYVEQVGLVVEDISYCDYWPQSGLRRALEFLVPSLRRGITLIARRPRD